MVLVSHMVMAVAVCAAPTQLELSKLPPADELVQLLWERSSEVAEVRARVGLADADVSRAELLPNPGLDLGLAGVPVGDTNPPGLTFGQTANGAVTLSELIEIGKRGPRQRSAVAGRDAVALGAAELVRQQYLDLQLRIADIASSQVKIAAHSEAVGDAARLTTLQAARSGKGDAAGVDTDRARLEEQKLASDLGAERETLQQALRDCGRLVGVPCLPFTDAKLAQDFLDARSDGTGDGDVTKRADLQALEAQARSADEAAVLAERHLIPDPTVRAGYVRDTFVISGNNPNTLFFGVSIPLPVFDRGQVDAQAARVTASASRRARELLVERAGRDVERLGAQLAQARARHQALKGQTIPLARRVVDSLEKAMLVGSPLQDLLLARRTLQDLVVAEAEVDLLVYQTSIELDRVSGRGPQPPRELALK